MARVILLIQKSHDKSTRSYEEYDSLEEAFEDVIKVFESRLKALRPNCMHINYSLEDLNRYIDHHKEFCMLVLESENRSTSEAGYVPKDLEWIKNSIHVYLQTLWNSTNS